jgi:hypothetical protein
MAVRVPVKYLSYFHAKGRQSPMMDGLVEAIRRGSQQKADELIHSAAQKVDEALAEKEFLQAAELQHSQGARSFQELVQNSMDAYLAMRQRGELEGPGIIEVEQKENRDGTRNFVLSDKAGGLDTEGIIRYLLTVGATSKVKGSVGGHGQGFKAIAGISKEVVVNSRDNAVRIFKEGGEYFAEFSKLKKPLQGTSVEARGIRINYAPTYSIIDYANFVDPTQYQIVSKYKSKQAVLNSREGYAQLGPVATPIGPINIFAQAYHHTQSGELNFTQSGLAITSVQGEKPTNGIKFVAELPTEVLLTRGRDTVPQEVHEAVMAKLPKLRKNYLNLLLKSETLTPRELALLQSARFDWKKLGGRTAKVAAAAALAYGASKLNLPDIAEHGVQYGAYALGAISAIPVVYGIKNTIAKRLASREKKGVSVTKRRLGFSLGGLFTPSIANKKVIPAVSVENGKQQKTKISLNTARREFGAGRLFLSKSLESEELEEGLNVHADYAELLKPEQKEEDEGRLREAAKAVGGFATQLSSQVSYPLFQAENAVRQAFGSNHPRARLVRVASEISRELAAHSDAQNIGVGLVLGGKESAHNLGSAHLPLASSWVALNLRDPLIRRTLTDIKAGRFTHEHLNALTELVVHEYAHSDKSIPNHDHMSHYSNFYAAKERLMSQARGHLFNPAFQDRLVSIANGRIHR